MVATNAAMSIIRRGPGVEAQTNNVAIFWMQILTSAFVFGIVSAWYVWPALTKLSRKSALTLLLFVQVSRYMGMTLLRGLP